MFKMILATAVALAGMNAYAADVYKIDTKASSVVWKGTKKMGSFHTGGIAVKEGEVNFNKGTLSTGNIIIDMSTITNEDLKDAEYNKKLVGHLSNEDFFNVTKFPTATFKITSVAPTKAKETFTVKGDFTMIGKTQPIEFPATITHGKDTVTGKAAVKVDRTKFGLKYGSGNFFKELTGDKIINDDFELTLNFVAAKAPVAEVKK